jgi:hypothetical protein
MTPPTAPRLALLLLSCLTLNVPAAPDTLPAPWSAERTRDWYEAQPWLVGANFVPSTASNQLEMWQAETFDPGTIDRELGWAADLGFNCMRVFLHDMLWTDDREGFFERIDAYLAIADRHGILTMFVLFDSVWDPHPRLGPQPEPIPGIHNSRWVQSPHIDILGDPSRHGEMEPYVTSVLARYADDPRVLLWDLYNEPGNRVLPYREHEPENKRELSESFLRRVFAWARAVNPSQPLTAGVWERLSGDPDSLESIDHLMLDNSDVITFHSYAPLPRVQATVRWLRAYGRPLICTEYLSRQTQERLHDRAPLVSRTEDRRDQLGAGQRAVPDHLSLDLLEHALPQEPTPWFHDIFRPDGSPFDPAETAVIQALTGATPD